MKTIVVDASTCLKWVFEEEDSELARRLLIQSQTGELLLLAPELWEYEIINALTSAVLRKKISSFKSHTFLELIFLAKVETVSMAATLAVCLENALKYKISGYDSAYVTLAKESSCPLVSADAKLIAKIHEPGVIISLKEAQDLL